VITVVPIKTNFRIVILPARMSTWIFDHGRSRGTLTQINAQTAILLLGFSLPSLTKRGRHIPSRFY
jgi:hypothetical protein